MAEIAMGRKWGLLRRNNRTAMSILDAFSSRCSILHVHVWKKAVAKLMYKKDENKIFGKHNLSKTSEYFMESLSVCITIGGQSSCRSPESSGFIHCAHPWRS